MTRIQSYWQEVRRLEAELPAVVAVVPLTPNARPTVALVERVTGARLLADERARLATPEEIKAFRAGEDRRALVAEALEQRRVEGVLVLPCKETNNHD